LQQLNDALQRFVAAPTRIEALALGVIAALTCDGQVLRLVAPTHAATRLVSVCGGWLRRGSGLFA
jgi:hypothetical protein